MRAYLWGFCLLGLLAGCAENWDPSPRHLASSTPAQALHAPVPDAYGPAGRTSGAGFAALPDHGDLVAYDKTRPPIRAGAYTWHRVELSEEHALRAVTGRDLVVTGPNGRPIRLKYESHVEHPDGNWTWIGRVPGDRPGSEAIITFGDKAVFGSIPYGDEEPLRLTIAGGRAWLMETDRAAIARMDNAAASRRQPDFLVPPADLGTPVSHALYSASQMAEAISSVTAATTVDVLLGYTSGFAIRLGGQSQAVTRLTYLVDVTNQAYANSQVDARIRLVRTMQVDYPDATSNQAALYALTGVECTTETNGSLNCTYVAPAAALQPLHAARDQYGADLISLVRNFNNPENGGCGIAWLIGGAQTNIDSSDAESGMSVVSDSSGGSFPDDGFVCRDETLAHELGHNMGSAHDRDTADGDDNILQANEYGRYPYSFGYKAPAGAGNFYTVMAYGDGGQAKYRVFSNPNINYCGGFACGIANQADNAASLRLTMPVIGTFRASLVTTANPPKDINGDGRSDVLWHNVGLQQMDWWYMNGPARLGVSSKFIPNQYRVAATGDFNGDGRGDILWRDEAKTSLWLWQSDAVGGFSIHFVDNYPPVGWEVVGAADVNGDGRSDVLWHNIGLQQMDWWYMNGPARLGVSSKFISSQYRVSATGDFNGDGRGDILWRDEAKTSLWMWQSDAFGGFSIHFVDNYPPAGWEVVGAADINGDGRSDVLWHNIGLQQMDWWYMNGPARLGVSSKFISTQYRVATTGDFNGDGRGDILWRDDAKTSLWIWQSDTSGGFSIHFVDNYPPPSWEIIN